MASFAEWKKSKDKAAGTSPAAETAQQPQNSAPIKASSFSEWREKKKAAEDGRQKATVLPEWQRHLNETSDGIIRDLAKKQAAMNSVEQAGRESVARSFSGQNTDMAEQSLKLRDVGMKTAAERASEEAGVQHRKDIESVLGIQEENAGQKNVRPEFKGSALPIAPDVAKKLQEVSEIVSPTTQFPDQGLMRKQMKYAIAKNEWGWSDRDAAMFAITDEEDLSNEAILESGKKTKATNAMRREMTEEEARNLREIRALYGSDAAGEYLSAIAPSLATRPWERMAEESPWLASAASIAMNAASGVGALDNLRTKGMTGEVNPYSVYNQMSLGSGAIRSVVAKKWDDNWNGFVKDYLVDTGLVQSAEAQDFLRGFGENAYSSLMSNLDNAVAVAAAFAAGGGSASKVAVENMALLFMGSSAATATTADALLRGVSDERAMTLGFAAGIIEALTEKMGLDALMGTSKGVLKKAFKGVLGEKLGAGWLLNMLDSKGASIAVQGVTEGLEEWIAEWANAGADFILSTDKSEWAQQIEELMANGKNYEQAWRIVLCDQMEKSGEAFDVGLLSGLFSGTGVSIINQAGKWRGKASETNQKAQEALRAKFPVLNFSNAQKSTDGGVSSTLTLNDAGIKETFSQKLAESGVDADKIEQLAPVMEKATRQRLSAKEQALMQSNPQAQAILLQAMQGRTVLQPTTEATRENVESTESAESDDRLQLPFYEDTNAEGGRVVRPTVGTEQGNAGNTENVENDGGLQLPSYKGADSESGRMVKTNIGNVPIEDYREIKAAQYGFDSYADLRAQGYSLGDGYDVEVVAEDTAANDDGALRLPAYTEDAPAAQSADLQLTANDTRQEQGGMNDGTEQRTDALPYASQKRVDGVGAGGQAGGVASRAGSRAAALERARPAIRRQNRAYDLRLEPVSTRELGIADGTDGASVTELPESAWDDAMRTTAQRVEAEVGLPVRYVAGSMPIQVGEAISYVRGVFTGEAIVIQADNTRMGIDQIADHEMFHGMAAQDQALVASAMEKIRETFSEEEFAEIVQQYKEAYQGIYNEEDDHIVEEILADAYAGIDDFGAAAYSETVHGVARERHGKSAEPVRDGEGRAPPVEDDGAIRLPSHGNKTGEPTTRMSLDFSEGRGYAERETSTTEGGDDDGNVERGERSSRETDAGHERISGSLGKDDSGRESSRGTDIEGNRGEDLSLDKGAVGRGDTGADSQRRGKRPDYLRRQAIEPEIGSPASYIVYDAQRRGIEALVVPADVWEGEFGKNAAQVKSKDGIILMIESVDGYFQGLAVPHEETHIMLQEKYVPYVEFLNEFPNHINYSSPTTSYLFQKVLQHKGYSFEDIDTNPTKRQLFYDEVCAALYGQIAAGETRGTLEDGTTFDIADVLYDIDAFAEEIAQLQDARMRERLAERRVQEDDGAIRLPSYEDETGESTTRYSVEPGAKADDAPAWDVNNRPDYVSQEEWESALKERARILEEESAMQSDSSYIVPKGEFKGSAAMKALDIQIEGSAVPSYAKAGRLRTNAETKRQAERDLAKLEKRLKLHVEETRVARQVADGDVLPSDIPREMPKGKILTLADMYAAVDSVRADGIHQQRRLVNERIDAQIDRVMDGVEPVRKLEMVVMNYSSPERMMRAMFGDEKGAEIFREFFAPVEVNNAEKARFVSRLFDEVRELEGEDGKSRELNKEERAAVQMIIEGATVEETVKARTDRAQIEAAAKLLKGGADVKEVTKQVELKGEGAYKLAEQYAQWMRNQDEMAGMEKLDAARVDAAVESYRKLYNQLYDAINDHLVVHGYEPIGFVKGYAPHMQPDAEVNRLMKAFNHLGINTTVTELPASIAGQTADRKPGKRFDPFMLERHGTETEYDIVAGFESYAEYIADVFYHTDDIMRIRRLSDYFRRTYSDENISQNISWARNIRFAPTDVKTELLVAAGKISRGSKLTAEDTSRMFDDYVDELYENVGATTKYSNFVMWLDNYANILAGKQNMGDRGTEYDFGRKSLNVGRRLQRAFVNANVVGNLSSVLNQSAQLSAIVAECGEINTARAIRDILQGRMRQGGFVENSDFLVGKRGVDKLDVDAYEKVVDFLAKPLEYSDFWVSRVAVRAAWYKSLKNGADAQMAMKEADRFARRVMGSRLKGEMPLMFENKGFIKKCINMFQQEVVNIWGHALSDVPYEAKMVAQAKGKNAAAKYIATLLVRYLLSAFLLNRASEELYGGTPAPFDLGGLISNLVASGYGFSNNTLWHTIIDNGWEKLTGERLFDTEAFEEDAEFNWRRALEDTRYNAMNDIPLLQNASAVLGWGDGSLAIPDLKDPLTNLWNAAYGEDLTASERGEKAAEGAWGLVTQLAPGGRQLKKTAEGIDVMAKGGSYKGYGDDRKLQYPVDGTFGEWIAAALFGKAGLNENEDFYASGKTALSEKQTDVYDAMVDDGADRIETYDTIQAIRAKEDARAKRAALAQADLTDRQKAQLYSGIISDSRDEEFAAMLDAGLTWQEITDAFDRYSELYEEEGKTASSKATEYALWVDKNRWTDEQGELVKESFKFYSMVPADASKYEALESEGLSSDVSYRVTQTLAALTPEMGKSSVSSAQRYRAIVGMNLSEEEKQIALFTCMSDGVRQKMDAVCEYGVTPTQYVGYITAASADTDESGSVSQEEAKRYIDSIEGLTEKQRAALWQATNKSWKESKNPYNRSVGADVRQALNVEDEEDDGEIRLPKW